MNISILSLKIKHLHKISMVPTKIAVCHYAFERSNILIRVFGKDSGIGMGFFPLQPKTIKMRNSPKKKLADIFQRRGAGIFLPVSISNKNTDVMPALQKAFEADAYRKEFTYMMLSNLSSFSRPMPARSSFQIFQHGFQLNPRHQFSFSEMRRRVKF